MAETRARREGLLTLAAIVYRQATVSGRGAGTGQSQRTQFSSLLSTVSSLEGRRTDWGYAEHVGNGATGGTETRRGVRGTRRAGSLARPSAREGERKGARKWV